MTRRSAPHIDCIHRFNPACGSLCGSRPDERDAQADADHHAHNAHADGRRLRCERRPQVRALGFWRRGGDGALRPRSNRALLVSLSTASLRPFEHVQPSASPGRCIPVPAIDRGVLHAPPAAALTGVLASPVVAPASDRLHARKLRGGTDPGVWCMPPARRH
eukprot:6553181-Prymnesium_polylepis.1